MVLSRLLKRSEFLAVAASGHKVVASGLIMQWLNQPANPHVRYGLTASRKVGGAVQRNRARRRLRALACELLPHSGLGAYDLVFIARPATLSRPFNDLRNDMRNALAKVRP